MENEKTQTNSGEIPVPEKSPRRSSTNKMLLHNQLWKRRELKKAAYVNNILNKAMEKSAALSGFADLSYFPSNDPVSEQDAFNFADTAPTVLLDADLGPAQKAFALTLLQRAQKNKADAGFTTNDLIMAGLGAGLGYGAAKLTGKVLGTIFSLPDSTQRTISQLGELQKDKEVHC
jgi:hypothetical protein